LKALELYREREVVIDPEHAVLLIMDIQNSFHPKSKIKMKV